MQIIKLDATDSTNVYLKNLMLHSGLNDFTVVAANHQYKGRGQRGTTWESEKGKNLTFSVLKKHDALFVQQQFSLNIKVSLAVYRTLMGLQIPDLKIKWPNDILSGNYKICGTLIENILSGSKIQASVIGIGLNINQIDFANLPNVSSLKLIVGNHFDLNEVLNKLLKNLKDIFDPLLNGDENKLKEAYLNALFRKDKAATFKNQSNEMFTGIIRTISEEGKLIIEIEDKVLTAYDLKEVQLLY